MRQYFRADRYTGFGDPLIDVVVLTWNDGPLLERAVRSALESEDVDVAVHVVDNGSMPPAVVAPDPRVTVRRCDRNLGVAAGRNFGVSLGESPVVCFLDSDARLHPRTLADLRDALLGSPDIGLVGPVFSGQRPEDSGGRAPTLLRKVARVIGTSTRYGRVSDREGDRWDVDFVIGACQVFRREAFAAVGGLDDRWFYGPEDADFCLRLRSVGWRVLQCVNVVCDHPPRRRNRRLFTRRGLSHARAVIEFLWRHRRYRRGRS